MPLPFLAMLNTPEIILLLVLALVLFGAKKLPELARGLGHGIREFKKATQDVQSELQTAMNAEPSAPPKPAAPPTEALPAPAAPPAETVPQSTPPQG